MPIYAYKCGACGHAKDVLQKMSDAPLTHCPACGAAAFSKQLTAPGFQLKGSAVRHRLQGWNQQRRGSGGRSLRQWRQRLRAAAGCPAAIEAVLPPCS